MTDISKQLVIFEGVHSFTKLEFDKFAVITAVGRPTDPYSNLDCLQIAPSCMLLAAPSLDKCASFSYPRYDLGVFTHFLTQIGESDSLLVKLHRRRLEYKI